jgi:hypothetical protein
VVRVAKAKILATTTIEIMMIAVSIPVMPR